LTQPYGTTAETSLLEFDGSYAGFLCAVAETLNQMHSPLPELRSATQPEPAGLFEQRLSVQTDPARAARLLDRLARRRSEQCIRAIELAFACDQTTIDGIASCEATAHALRRLWLEGENSQQALDDPKILAFSKAVTRSKRECHLFKGISRFAELADEHRPGTLYAAIRPACDISAFVAEHFVERLPNQPWVLHDSGRGHAFLHQPGSGLVRVEQLALTPEEAGEPGEGNTGTSLYSAEEKLVRQLWQQYFKSVSIAERENPRCQRNFLPLKHRWNLPEFAG